MSVHFIIDIVERVLADDVINESLELVTMSTIYSRCEPVMEMRTGLSCSDVNSNN